MWEIMVLPSMLVIACVVVGECKVTREKNSKRVNKKPVLRLVTRDGHNQRIDLIALSIQCTNS